MNITIATTPNEREALFERFAYLRGLIDLLRHPSLPHHAERAERAADVLEDFCKPFMAALWREMANEHAQKKAAEPTRTDA